jgi:hypothetical protein
VDKYNNKQNKAYKGCLHFIILGNLNSYYYNVITKGLAYYTYYKKSSYAYIPILNGLLSTTLEFFKLYKNT